MELRGIELWLIWAAEGLGPLLLTWVNFNLGMDKLSHAQ